MLREGIDHSVVQFWQIWVAALRHTNENLPLLKGQRFMKTKFFLDINALARFEFYYDT